MGIWHVICLIRIQNGEDLSTHHDQVSPYGIIDRDEQ